MVDDVMPVRHNALLPLVPVNGYVGREVLANQGRHLSATPSGWNHGIPLCRGDVQLLDNGQF